MTLYYIKQDNTIWCCEEDSGAYCEQIEESFVDCDHNINESEMTADHLHGCAGSGEVLKWRKAKQLEVQAWSNGKDDGFQEGWNAYAEWQMSKKGESK
jgi:hypothetical protein